MFPIEDADAVQVMPTRTPASTTVRHFFQAGNTRTGTPATVVTDDFLNIVQNELCNVVEAAGITLDKMDDNQLTMAILALIEKYAGKGGIPTWSRDDCYDPLPHIVWDDDLMIYIALKPSGKCVVAGPKKPTDEPAYWISLPEWVKRFINFDDGLPKPYGNTGTVLTVIGKDTLGWRSVESADINITEIIEAGTPKAAQTFYVRTDGSDNNAGLTNSSSGAFRTITGALTKIQQRQFTSPFDVTIRIANGIYLENVSISSGSISSASVTIVGESRDGVVIKPPTIVNGFVSFGGICKVSRLTVDCDFGSDSRPLYAIVNGGSGDMYIDGCKFVIRNSGGNASFAYAYGSAMVFTGNNVFTGTAAFGLTASLWGRIFIGDLSVTGTIQCDGVTISSYFVYAGHGGFVLRHTSGSISAANSNINARYLATVYGYITSNGAGYNWIPGNNAGQTDTATHGLYMP